MKAIGLLATLAACTGSDQLSPRQYDDVAAIVGSGIATPDRGGDLGAVSDSLLIARGDLPKGFLLAGDGSVTGSRGGIEYRYQVMCISTWDSSFAACDPPASSAVVQARWTGELSMSRFTGPMTRQGVWWLTHLDSPMGVVSGTSTLTAQMATFAEPERSYWVTDDQDLLMFAEMSSMSMMGGSVSSAIDVRTEGATYLVTAELQLDAGPRATLTLDDRTYTVDLDTGGVTRAAP